MGIRFFRINDRGQVSRPTPFAIIAFFVVFTILTILVGQYTIVYLLSIPVAYIACATVITTPFRVVVSKLMHRTREPIVKAPPTDNDLNWTRNIAPFMEPTGLKIYEGEEEPESKPNKESGGEK